MKIAIITCGYLPIPATKGGAVESIVENFIYENEKLGKIDFEVFSIYDEKAKIKSDKYKNTVCRYINTNILIKFIDNIIYLICKNILKKEKTMSYRYIAQRLYYINKVSKILKKENFDKIIIENHASLFLALKWRKNYKKYENKYYYHLHNEILSDYGCEKIIKKCKKIMCVSNFVKNITIKRLNASENTDNIVVLKNCIDFEKFNIELSIEEIKKLKQQFEINENEKILIFSGRLTKEKGILELIDSLENVSYDNYKILIVGSFFFGTKIKNNFSEQLNEKIQKIKDKVIFTGYVQYSEIPKIYNIADIAVLPSTWNDSAPLTIIESMASGLPIITTNMGGIPEYVNEKCAIILNNDEKLVENLTKSIDYLLNNDELTRSMSEESKKTASKLNLNSFYWDLLEKMEI